MDQEPKIRPTPESGPKILSFEEFSDRSSGVPFYNNFFLNFSDSESYRQKGYCLKFASEHEAEDKSLCNKIRNMMKIRASRSELLKSFDRELYEAYKIMRSYGASDDDLFS